MDPILHQIRGTLQDLHGDFRGMRQEVKVLAKTVDTLAKTVDTLAKTVDNLGKRVTTAEDNIGKLIGAFAGIETIFLNHEERITALEKRAG